MKIRKETAIFLIFLLVYAVNTKNWVSENDASRMVAVESIVERGTLAIDESTLMPGVDKIFVDGRFYSSKPPLLSVIGAIPYFFIHNFLGVSFRENTATAIYLVNLLTIASTSSLLMVVFYKSLAYVTSNEKRKNYLVFMLGFGTLIFTYSGVFNAHTISSFFLFYSFYLLLKLRFESENNKKAFFLGGFSLSIACAIEPPLYLTLLFFIPYLRNSKAKSNLAFYVLGVLIPLLIYAKLNFTIFDSIMPLHLQPFRESFYPERSWNEFSSEQIPRKTFLFNSLLGYQGFFSYTPLLFFGFYSMFKTSWRFKQKFSSESRIFLMIFLLLYSYYLFSGFNYGGDSVGLRRMISLTPFFVFSLGVFLEDKPSSFTSTLLLVFSVISVLIALIFSINPWSRMEGKVFYVALLFTTIIALLFANKHTTKFFKNFLSLND